MNFNKLIIIYFLTEYNNGEITSYDHHSYSNIFFINLIIIFFYVNNFSQGMISLRYYNTKII